jgi:hypothetical protein
VIAEKRVEQAIEPATRATHVQKGARRHGGSEADDQANYPECDSKGSAFLIRHGALLAI